MRQALLELFGLGAADGEGYLAGVVEGLGDNAGLKVLDDAHDVVHHNIGERIGYLLLYQSLFCVGIVEGKGGCLLICHDESARAELHASEVSYHEDEHVGELATVDLTQDGLACSAAWLSVVVGTKFGALLSEHICPTDMSRVEVFLAVLGHNVLHLIDCLDMMCEGEEFATLFSIVSLACFMFTYRLIYVHVF